MKFMKQAFILATRAKSHDDVPIGAVIVRDGKIIVRRVVSDHVAAGVHSDNAFRHTRRHRDRAAVGLPRHPRGARNVFRLLRHFDRFHGDRQKRLVSAGSGGGSAGGGFSGAGNPRVLSPAVNGSGGGWVRCAIIAGSRGAEGRRRSSMFFHSPGCWSWSRSCGGL